MNRRVDLPVATASCWWTPGFINKLPTELVEAFHSTLEEATLADILVIVSYAASPEYLRQHQVVEEVLEKLDARHQPRIEVLNKCDLSAPGDFEGIPGAIRVSARTGQGLDKLLDEIAKILRQREQPLSGIRVFQQLRPVERPAGAGAHP